VAEPVCIGRRYWTCRRCNTFTGGSRCCNCGFGASLRIWSMDSAEYADDALRVLRPAEETDGPPLIVGYELLQPDSLDESVGEAAVDVRVPAQVPLDNVVR
jgi:hypothetical protein